MRSPGTWLIRVGKYNSDGRLIGTTDKYIAIKSGSGSGSSSSGLKDIASLTYSCKTATGDLIIRDGTTTLGSGDYICGKSTVGIKYKYECRGRGNYTGSVIKYCNIP